jgi:hypothetical protein
MGRPRPGNSGKGQPPKNNLKKEPKTQQEQLQAVYNDFSSEIIGMAKIIQVEQELNSKPMDRLLGAGGKDLDGYAGQLQNGFKDIDPGNALAKKLASQKEDAPILKKVSKSESWGGDAGKAGSHSPPKSTGKTGKAGKK